MRSGPRIVSDEEERVIGVPTAQVTSNMPVLGASSAEPTPLRGLLIAAAVFVLFSLPRVCRCTDLGESVPEAHLAPRASELPDGAGRASFMTSEKCQARIFLSIFPFSLCLSFDSLQLPSVSRNLPSSSQGARHRHRR